MDRLANRIASHERKLQALELRKAGASYSAIAQQVGYRSASGAHAAVKAALKATLREPADDVRNLELERLDAALLAIWRRVTSGDFAAIDRLLGIINSRAKLTGSCAPQRLAATVDWSAVQNVDMEAVERRLEDMLAAMSANLAAAPESSGNPDSPEGVGAK
jgi:transposase-like protein